MHAMTSWSFRASRPHCSRLNSKEQNSHFAALDEKQFPQKKTTLTQTKDYDDLNSSWSRTFKTLFFRMFFGKLMAGLKWGVSLHLFEKRIGFEYRMLHTCNLSYLNHINPFSKSHLKMIAVSGLYSGCELLSVLFLVNSALCWALSRDSVDRVWLDIAVCQQQPQLHITIAGKLTEAMLMETVQTHISWHLSFPACLCVHTCVSVCFRDWKSHWKIMSIFIKVSQRPQLDRMITWY